MNTVWRENVLNGNANYDIDEDLSKRQFDIFEGRQLTKIESFQEILKEKILKKEITTNSSAYLYTLNQGHISRHADELIRKLKKEKLIVYEGNSPLINYDQVIKNKRKILYKVLDEKDKN